MPLNSFRQPPSPEEQLEHAASAYQSALGGYISAYRTSEIDEKHQEELAKTQHLVSEAIINRLGETSRENLETPLKQMNTGVKTVMLAQWNSLLVKYLVMPASAALDKAFPSVDKTKTDPLGHQLQVKWDQDNPQRIFLQSTTEDTYVERDPSSSMATILPEITGKVVTDVTNSSLEAVQLAMLEDELQKN